MPFLPVWFAANGLDARTIGLPAAFGSTLLLGLLMAAAGTSCAVVASRGQPAQDQA
jgi:hypothetical protein